MIIPRKLHIFFLCLLINISSATAFAQTSIMRIGTNPWSGYEPFYLAEKTSAWPKSARIRLIQFPSATEVIRAFRNKTLEAAALTLDEALLLKESGFPIKVVLVLDVSNGADVILGQKNWKNFKDIKGKRVGVESSALGAYIITRALSVNHMQLKDINVVDIHIGHHEEAFLSGKVDAVATFEPTRTRLLNSGAKELFSSREIPGEIVDVLVVHEDFLKHGEHQLQKLINGWFKSLQMLSKEPIKATTIIASRLHITPEEVIESYKGIILPDIQANRKMIGGSNPEIIPPTSKLVQIMKNKKLLRQGVSLNRFFTGQYLP